MKTIRLLILILFLTSGIYLSSHAQDRQQQKIDSVFKLLKGYINAKNGNAIYSLTGTGLRKTLTSETLQNFLEGRIFPAGEILSSSLITYTDKTSKYKLDFKASSSQLLLNLDAEDKISLFLFQPYQKPAALQKAVQVATTNPMRSVQDKQIDSVARQYIQRVNTAGMSIGIIKNGVMSTYHYGETAKGNGHLPDANTIFEIGSITKTFTSTLLAWYVNEGKLKLTDPITKYLPDSVAANPNLQDITLVNLSNHTSGLPGLPENFFMQPGFNALDPYINFNKPAVYSYLKTCKLNGTPGEKYVYSNLAVALLGSILEKVSGKTYEQMISDIICKPLNMNSTAIHLTKQLEARMVPAVYNNAGEATPIWTFGELAAHGGLRSTITDLLLYGKAQMDLGKGKLYKAMQLTQQVTFNHEPKVALAWHMINLGGNIYTFHNGRTYGSSSYLAFNTEKHFLVIILSNAFESVDATGNGIAKALQ